MSLATNPRHRLISAPVAPADAPSAELSPVVRVLRWVAYAIILLLLAFFLSGGTLESRVTYLIAFFIALVNPIWGIYALGLMAPLYLLDQPKTHLLAGLEVFAIGIIAGELRLLGREVVGLDAAGQPNAEYSLGGKARRVFWGIWPHFLIGLTLVLFASSLMGWRLTLGRENPFHLTPYRILNIPTEMFFGAATIPEWALKSFWNWTTGMLVAVVMARRANPLFVARWMKLMGLSLSVGCFFALLDWLHWLPLTQLRRPNPDILQMGRLQGTAGHAGWFGQYIVLAWPGLLLWWSRGRTKRNLALSVLLALVGVCLVLTAARAAWLGVAVAIAFGCIYLVYTYPELRRLIPIVIVAGLVVGAVGVIAGGETLRLRLIHILRAQDRANYYVTGLMLLRDHPFGVGLGLHYFFYDWTFLPFFRWYQMDHVTAHSLWLHTLIENGPFVPLLIVCGLTGLAADVKRSWHLFDPHTRTILASLCLAIVGIFTLSFAQYIAYIRVIELTIWIALGAAVGLCRKKRCRTDEAVGSWRGRRVVMICAVMALIIASMNAGRSYAGRMPRLYDAKPGYALDFWTGSDWRVPVNHEVNHIQFTIYRKVLPAHGVITWPNGKREEFNVEPEQYKFFQYDQPAGEDHWYERPDYLEIQVSPLFVPAETIEGSTDRRQLGVYVSGLRFNSPRLLEWRKEADANSE